MLWNILLLAAHKQIVTQQNPKVNIHLNKKPWFRGQWHLDRVCDVVSSITPLSHHPSFTLYNEVAGLVSMTGKAFSPIYNIKQPLVHLYNFLNRFLSCLGLSNLLHILTLTLPHEALIMDIVSAVVSIFDTFTEIFVYSIHCVQRPL